MADFEHVPQSPMVDGMGELYGEEDVNAGALMVQEVQQDDGGDAAANAIQNRLAMVLTGPNRNFFAHNDLKQEFLKPIEILNRAATGRRNHKELINSSDKERLNALKKQMGQRKTLVTAWLLKRRSLLSRFNDGERFAFAKFILKDYTYKSPNAEDVCSTFRTFLHLADQSVAVVLNQFIKNQLASIAGISEFLQNNRAYVEKMNRINASVNAGGCPIEQAVCVKRVAFRTLMDLISADYLDFRFNMIIDHDDQMSHYDVQHVTSDGIVAANNVNPEALVRQEAAQSNLENILNIIGQNNGDREALRVNLYNEAVDEAGEWDETSFMRDLLGADGSQRSMQQNLIDIATENDATSILMHYMLEPKQYDPGKRTNIIEARLGKEWCNRIQRANEGDENSQKLLRIIPPPLGLMTYQQAIDRIIQSFEGNIGFEKEVAEAGMADNVIPFSMIIEYCTLNESCRQMEESGQTNTAEYAALAERLNTLYPFEERNGLAKYLEQYNNTRRNFEEIGVSEQLFAKPDLQYPGSAIQCFPDNCESTDDAHQITEHVKAYLSLKKTYENTEESIKSGGSFASSSVNQISARMEEMVRGPSVDDLRHNDAKYFDRHFDAPWVQQLEDSSKLGLYRLYLKQSEILNEETERQIASAWHDLREHGDMAEVDVPIFESKLRLAFQKKPDLYVVEGTTQTLGSDGKTQSLKVQYISPETMAQIKAQRATEQTPIKWSVVAGSVWKLIERHASLNLEQLQERSVWHDGHVVDVETLREAVCQILTAENWAAFVRILLTDIKTSIDAEEEAASKPKTKKRRRTITPDLEAGANDLDDFQTIAKKGRLIITSGGTTKKKQIVYAP